jgi:hypothetical protein
MQPPNRRVQLTGFGARARAFFEVIWYSAPRRQLKRSTFGSAGDQEACDGTARRVRRPARRTQAMVPILVTALVVFGLPTLYFAIRSREFRKFLAGAFFVSSGMQFYFYLANVSVPLVGTSIVQTPELSGVRSILHFIFFLVTFYFGFIRKPKDSSK